MMHCQIQIELPSEAQTVSLCRRTTRRLSWSSPVRTSPEANPNGETPGRLRLQWAKTGYNKLGGFRLPPLILSPNPFGERGTHALWGKGLREQPRAKLFRPAPDS